MLKPPQLDRMPAVNSMHWRGFGAKHERYWLHTMCNDLAVLSKTFNNSMTEKLWNLIIVMSSA